MGVVVLGDFPATWPALVRTCTALYAFYDDPGEFIQDCEAHTVGETEDERMQSLLNWAVEELVNYHINNPFGEE